MTAQLHTITKAEDAAAVVYVAGELDLYTAPQLANALQALFSDPPPAVVVDLCDVSFLDSTGINVLVRAGRELRARACEFSVRNPRPQVRKVLDMVGLAERFGLTP